MRTARRWYNARAFCFVDAAVHVAIPEIDLIVSDAIAQRVFPGAIVRVTRGDTRLHDAAYGTTMYDDPGSQPVRRDTRYDIASLTKMFTATAVLQLVDEARVALDAPVADYLPALHASDVCVRHLLTHTSGLAVRLSALRETGRAGILEAVYASVPTTSPGAHAAYSNINSLLLGELVATLRGMPLDVAIQRYILAPLGMHDTGFLPDASHLHTIAPTEWDDTWRQTLVRGSVHDESAHALGGVAGHAGLFSTAADLERFCLAWMQGDVPLVSAALAAQAVTNQTPGRELACGLGWMLDRPSFMGTAAPIAYGHTGFTGPVMLVMPQQHTCLIVLSNRTYPRRTAPVHHAVTARIATALLHAYASHDTSF